ncbi:hypothetical protein KP509_04G098300 [Ceratopteris richardii]|uniref:Thioredoxin domain-containing protein n=1 Tax=Ceratopteris richardii TaxID=49495 RepID=A0A8T2UYF0_CERRI|nr:hypothetical protein KP509_04G098300 [Ceratopteris richardii]
MKMTVASSLLSPFACSLVTCCGLLLCVLCSAIHPSSRQLPWIRLTSDNFSSEIHTYPFVLCLATVPWSGESRSLMTDLSETLGVNENLHISTQLRVVYINQDKCLDKFFLQSKRYLAFTFFWYSTPFRYKGKLRAQNILTAINHAVSLKSSDYPFKRLETKSDLDRFRESTDRAVILFDFCNYSDRIKDRHHSKKDKSIQLFARSRKAKDVEGVKRLVGLEEELLYEGSPCLTSNVECAIVSPGKQLVLESIRNPSSLLNDTSSVVLFIDRVSPVMDVRKKSWEALKALRAFARGYFNQENLELHLNAYPEVKGEPYLANKGLSSFVHSIFESRVPKEDVNSQESTSYAYTVSHLTDKSTRISENGPTDFGHNVVMKILVEGQKNLQLDASLLKEDLQSLDIGSILLTEDDFVSRKIEEKKNQKIDTQSPLSKVESLFSSNIGSFIEFHPAKMSPELKEDHQEVDEKVNMQSDNHNSFSFYFADGEDQWKEVIEPSLPYPSIVILDFLQEEKFVFSAPNRSIDYTSLKGFFERYADNQLQKTYLSEVAPNKPRKRVQPPFVNRDFHETDGVPRITTERLLRLLGYSVGRHRDVSSFDSTEDMGQLCKKSALVLYTAPACGFCKRMELVFREVHRMITLYLDGSGDSSFMQEVEHTYSTFDMGDKDMNIGGNLPVFAS